MKELETEQVPNLIQEALSQEISYLDRENSYSWTNYITWILAPLQTAHDYHLKPQNHIYALQMINLAKFNQISVISFMPDGLANLYIEERSKRSRQTKIRTFPSDRNSLDSLSVPPVVTLRYNELIGTIPFDKLDPLVYFKSYGSAAGILRVGKVTSLTHPLVISPDESLTLFKIAYHKAMGE